MNLFSIAGAADAARQAPLAARMRPRDLNEIVGQEHIIGPGTLLRRAIEADRLISVILWGPPGSGKTTLARIVAKRTKAHFEQINAVTAGVQDLRKLIDQARDRRDMHGQRTIVFIDEIHRFNRAQQDVLLPAVEDGLVTLIGATTENPFFEVNAPLLSRLRVFQLRHLSAENMKELLRRAVTDPERGYGGRRIQVEDEALEYWAMWSEGDARVALNALELAVETTPERNGAVVIDLRTAQEAMQQRILSYDKGADEHYDTISAFIKSVRGSDVDAALYWLAKMIKAGEDPRFIMRRLLILAAEDVGLADPQGLVVAVAGARALEWCGLPEAQYHLAMVTIYLATAPKSNRVGAYFKALQDVEKQGAAHVPEHLKDPTRDAKHLGHGKDYIYPHDAPEHWVAQHYGPPGRHLPRYYEPSGIGYERVLSRWLSRIRRGEPPGWDQCGGDGDGP
ncbi:MAG: replication-associated recombination protein A [Limnochordia bacterium]